MKNKRQIPLRHRKSSTKARGRRWERGLGYQKRISQLSCVVSSLSFRRSPRETFRIPALRFPLHLPPAFPCWLQKNSYIHIQFRIIHLPILNHSPRIALLTCVPPLSQNSPPPPPPSIAAPHTPTSPQNPTRHPRTNPAAPCPFSAFCCWYLTTPAAVVRAMGAAFAAAPPPSSRMMHHMVPSTPR